MSFNTSIFDSSSQVTTTINPIQDIKVTPNIKVIENITNNVLPAQNVPLKELNSFIPLGRNNTFSIPAATEGSLPKTKNNRINFSSLYVVAAIAVGIFILKDRL